MPIALLHQRNNMQIKQALSLTSVSDPETIAPFANETMLIDSNLQKRTVKVPIFEEEHDELSSDEGVQEGK